MRKILLFISIIITTVVFGQYTTPTIDGSIGGSEYGSDNSYTSGTRTWNITWDATNLYVGVSGHTSFSDAIVLFIDTDPQVPVNGGGNSNGTSTGPNYDNVVVTLPFRADFFAYVKDGYDDYKSDDGANGWGGSTTGSLTKSFNGTNNVGEFAIPWSAITGSGIPASFNFVAFMSYTSGTFSQAPNLNPTGTTPEYIRYFTVSNTGDGTSTAPFSQESYCHISGDATGFGAIDVFDFTMNVSTKTITRATGAGGVWEIANDLIITDGTIDFGISTAEVIVNGDVNIESSGTLKLSTAVGGDIKFGGDWSCSGTFTPNDRAIFVIGAGDQTINNNSNFDYVIIDKSGGALDFFGSNTSETIDNNLTISNGTFEIPAGKSLTVSGDLSNSGTFTLKSDQTGKPAVNPTGSLIVNGTVLSNINIERYIPGYSKGTGWHLLSSPVAAQAISVFDNVGGSDDFYKWVESANAGLGEWDNRSEDDGSGGSVLDGSFETEFVVGRGYLVGYSSPLTKTFSGTINNSDVPIVSLTNTNLGPDDGWNLIGNPFSSAVKWDESGTWSLDKVSGIAKYYDESGAGNYISINQDDYIPAMQGFFVQVQGAAAGSLNILKSSRSHGGSGWVKSENSDWNSLKLKVSGGNNTYYDFVRVNLNELATNEYDLEFDSHKLFGDALAPQFFATNNGERYSDISFNYETSKKSVDLAFRAGTDGEYTIEVVLNTLDIADGVYLEDLEKNIIIDLSKSTTYTFNATTDDNENRFKLHLGATGIAEVQKEALQAYISEQNLYILGEEGQAQLSVYDIQGKQLFNEQVELNNQFRQSLDLPQGVYVVSVQSNELVKTAKVIIK